MYVVWLAKPLTARDVNQARVQSIAYKNCSISSIDYIQDLFALKPAKSLFN
jgi:hypothetical protein